MDILGLDNTVYTILGLAGGVYTSTGSCIVSLLTISLLVHAVAVAVNAITLTCCGIKLRISPFLQTHNGKHHPCEHIESICLCTHM